MERRNWVQTDPAGTVRIAKYGHRSGPPAHFGGFCLACRSTIRPDRYPCSRQSGAPSQQQKRITSRSVAG